MKKTILLLALGLGAICFNSCSRGYGCLYTMDPAIQNQNTDLAIRKEHKNAKVNEEELSITVDEAPVTEVSAD